MDADWDNLLILDSCRYDLFSEVVVEDGLKGELTTFRSRGSSSSEFLKENFAGRTYDDTVYVTANPHEKRILDSTFHHTDRVWIDGWDDEAGVILPETLAKRTMAAHDTYPNKRLIAHFMQPHVPFIGETRLNIEDRIMDGFRGIMLDEGDIGMEFNTVWAALSEGKVDKEMFWKAYRDNLRYVLEEALPLAEQLPGKTVITADHGNAIGEYAFPFPIPVYFHPSGIRLPMLNDVPWFVPLILSGKRSSDRMRVSRNRRPVESNPVIQPPPRNPTTTMMSTRTWLKSVSLRLAIENKRNRESAVGRFPLVITEFRPVEPLRITDSSCSFTK